MLIQPFVWWACCPFPTISSLFAFNSWIVWSELRKNLIFDFHSNSRKFQFEGYAGTEFLLLVFSGFSYYKNTCNIAVHCRSEWVRSKRIQVKHFLILFPNFSESRKPLEVFRTISREGWCLEAKRFCEEVTNDIVSLTGMNFFNLTRRLVLSVAGLSDAFWILNENLSSFFCFFLGTIVTYELVIHFESEKLSKFNQFF